MGEIKVSVIVPVYNVEKYLNECIDSLIGQTLKDIEILLIDDGSTDSSGEMCDLYAHEYENVRVIHKENEGQGKARNIGLLHVEGKYVYYMDSDDLLEKEALQFLYERAERENIDVIMFSAECFSDEAKIKFNQTEYQRTKYLNEVMSGEELFAKIFSVHEYYCSIPMRFYNREYLIDNKFEFPLDIIHEDELFGFTSLVQSRRAVCIENAFYKRRFRSGSTMTAKKAYRSAMGYVYTWKGLIEIYENSEFQCKKIYWNFSQNFLKLVINLYYKSFSNDEKKSFENVRKNIKNMLGVNFKYLERKIQLFLVSPVIYGYYRKLIKIDYKN